MHFGVIGKTIPVQAWTGSYGSRRLRQLAREGGRVVSHKHWPPLLPKDTPGTHFG
jgi:hypothetical protein